MCNFECFLSVWKSIKNGFFSEDAMADNLSVGFQSKHKTSENVWHE